MEKLCKNCGVTIKKAYKESLTQWKEKRFCSRTCFGQNIKVPLARGKCALCNRTFTRRKRSDAKYKYCSRKCAGRAGVKIATAVRDFIGEKNPAWKGGKTKSVLGYILLNEQLNNKKIKILEHRRIMELHLKRTLTQSEVIHHINGNKEDNRIENLRICKNQSEHMKIHHNKL